MSKTAQKDLGFTGESGRNWPNHIRQARFAGRRGCSLRSIFSATAAVPVSLLSLEKGPFNVRDKFCVEVEPHFGQVCGVLIHYLVSKMRGWWVVPLTVVFDR